MHNLDKIEESILSNMKRLEDNLWELSDQAKQNRNASKMEKISSIIMRKQELSGRIGSLFHEIKRVASGMDTVPDENQGIIIRVRGEKPVLIKWGSRETRIKNWYEIPISIANWILEKGKNLVEIENFISQDRKKFTKSAIPKQLKNGWFIEIGDHKEALIKKAEKLLRIAGFSDKVAVENEI